MDAHKRPVAETLACSMPAEFDVSALSHLGLSDAAVTAYVEMLINDTEVPQPLVIELMRAGLIESYAGRIVPRSTADPVARWTTSRAAEERSVRRATAVVSDLLERHERRNAPGFLTYLRGEPAVTAAYGDLLDHAQEDVMEFIRGPFFEPESVHVMQQQSPAIDRGVTYRVLYQAGILRSQRFQDLLAQSIAMGEESRSHPSLPLRMVIADGQRAVVFLPCVVAGRGDGEEVLGLDGMLVTTSPLLEALVRLFEQYWPDGIDLSRVIGRDKTDDSELLHLLAQGLTDKAISRMLGLSARTVQRRVAEISGSLGVSGRFQLGVEAHRRGLVD